MNKFIFYFLFVFSLWAQDKPSISLGCRDCGMFSAWMDVLMALEQYDEGKYAGLTIDFQDQGLYYDKDKGLNWWNYYCEPICLGEQNNLQFFRGNPPFSTGGISYYITRKEANQLFRKYIKIRPEIIEEARFFYMQHFKGYYVIAIHYRGTDKVTEVPLVPYESFVEEIENKRIGFHEFKIFVATDDQTFLDFLTKLYPNRVCYQEAQRSITGDPLHISNPSSYQQGKEALIDAILLSQGRILIRSASNLSLWSTYFSPDMPVIELSHY